MHELRRQWHTRLIIRRSADDKLARDRWRPALIALGAFLIAFLAQRQIVLAYGVDMPFWDEWEDFPTIHASYRAGNLTLGQIFAPHNEHRIMTSRLITLALFAIRGEWSPVVGMLLSAVVVGCIAATWAYTLSRLGGPVWLAWISALLLASPIQFQNITCSFQICFYLLMLCVVTGVSAIVLAPAVTWRLVLVAIVAASLATFSLANGLLAWVALGICLLLKVKLAAPSEPVFAKGRGLRAKALGFLAIMIFQCVFYLQGLQIGASLATPVEKVFQMARWSMMALSYPFVDDFDQPIFLSVCSPLFLWIPLVLAARACMQYSHDERSNNTLVLIIGLMMFMILSSCMIGLGRADFSIRDGSRYTTIFVWNSLLVLFALVTLWRELAGKSVHQLWQKRLLLASLFVVLLCVHAVRAMEGLRQISLHAIERRQEEQTIITYLSDPSPNRQLNGPIPYPRKDMLKLRLDEPALTAILPPVLRRGKANTVPSH